MTRFLVAATAAAALITGGLGVTAVGMAAGTAQAAPLCSPAEAKTRRARHPRAHRSAMRSVIAVRSGARRRVWTQFPGGISIPVTPSISTRTRRRPNRS